ncbi:MAG: hypothetical protein IBJ12_07765 [Sphingomonadaceae bacterium]|nr:hypothetical protein [Sphingomonadaceae bacterium]
MDSRVNCAPLTLLLRDSVADTETALRSIFDSQTDITVAQTGPGNRHSVDIVYCGVTFRLALDSTRPDLSGLKKIFCNLDSSSVGSVLGISLGDHVAGGERVPAIVQGLLGVGQRLGKLLGATGAIWHPADILSGFPYFSEAVADYLGGGGFPALALVNFKGGKDGSIVTHGLALLSGQELEICPAEMGQSEVMRRVVRVVHDIATNGPVQNPVELAGIEAGEIIHLEPLRESGLLKMNAYSCPTG